MECYYIQGTLNVDDPNLGLVDISRYAGVTDLPGLDYPYTPALALLIGRESDILPLSEQFDALLEHEAPPTDPFVQQAAQLYWSSREGGLISIPLDQAQTVRGYWFSAVEYPEDAEEIAGKTLVAWMTRELGLVPELRSQQAMLAIELILTAALRPEEEDLTRLAEDAWELMLIQPPDSNVADWRAIVEQMLELLTSSGWLNRTEEGLRLPPQTQAYLKSETLTHFFREGMLAYATDNFIKHLVTFPGLPVNLLLPIWYRDKVPFIELLKRHQVIEAYADGMEILSAADHSAPLVQALESGQSSRVITTLQQAGHKLLLIDDGDRLENETLELLADALRYSDCQVILFDLEISRIDLLSINFKQNCLVVQPDDHWLSGMSLPDYLYYTIRHTTQSGILYDTTFDEVRQSLEVIDGLQLHTLMAEGNARSQYKALLKVVSPGNTAGTIEMLEQEISDGYAEQAAKTVFLVAEAHRLSETTLIRFISLVDTVDNLTIFFVGTADWVTSIAEALEETAYADACSYWPGYFPEDLLGEDAADLDDFDDSDEPDEDDYLFRPVKVQLSGIPHPVSGLVLSDFMAPDVVLLTDPDRGIFYWVNQHFVQYSLFSDTLQPETDEVIAILEGQALVYFTDGGSVTFTLLAPVSFQTIDRIMETLDYITLETAAGEVLLNPEQCVLIAVGTNLQGKK